MPAYSLNDLRSIRDRKPTENAILAFASEHGLNPATISMDSFGDQMLAWSQDLFLIRWADDWGTPIEGWSIPSDLPNPDGNEVNDRIICEWGFSIGMDENQSRFVVQADRDMFIDEIVSWWGKAWTELQSINDSKVLVGGKDSQPETAVKPDDEPFVYQNFTYTAEDEFEVTGLISRAAANIEAIKLVKLLESENREATDEEKRVLARYCGFGSVKRLFDTRAASTDHRFEWSSWRNSNDSTERRLWELNQELQSFVSKTEYQRLYMSMSNAHYTPQQLCHSMWLAAQKMGFKGGKVFDMGFGTGRIEGAIPKELQTAKIGLFGVELDPTTAKISQYLFPQATILNENIAGNSVQDGIFDLVISNPPYSKNSLGDGFNLHNYCINEGAKKLKAGGIMVVLTSVSTMENNIEQRKRLAEMLDLELAIRLPNNAMMKSANTEVIADLLVLRKRNPQEISQAEPWTNSIIVDVSAGTENRQFKGRDINGNAVYAPALCPINEYFANHPDHVLGQSSLDGMLYGGAEHHSAKGGQYTVKPTLELDQLWERVREIVSTHKYETKTAEVVYEPPPVTEASIFANELLQEGEMDFGPDGRAMVCRVGFQDGVKCKILLDPEWKTGEVSLPRGLNLDTAEELARDFISLKIAYNTLVRHDLSSKMDAPELRDALNSQYDSFASRWSSLFAVKTQLERIASSDAQLPIIQSLEVPLRQNGRFVGVGKSAIFSQRTVNTEPEAKCETVVDGIMLSFDKVGYADAGFISEVLGRAVTEPDLVETGLVFRDPESRKLVNATSYLSGDVVSKLARAQIASSVEPEFETNVTALNAVQPARIPIGDVGFALSSPWIPDSVFESFVLSEGFRCYSLKVIRQRNGSLFLSDSAGNPNPLIAPHSVEEKYGVYGTRFKAVNAFEHAILGKTANITSGKQTDIEATAEANSKIEQLKASFRSFVLSNPNICNVLEEAFNSSQNRIVEPVYNGNYLSFPLLRRGEGALIPRQHQRDVVARKLEEMCGMIPHKVGYGKTFELLLLGCELRRLGKARKPLIVADNASYVQFVDTAMSCLPNARILYSQEGDMSAKKRNRFLGKIANGDWDLVIMAQSHFNLIPNAPATYNSFFAEELADLEEAYNAAVSLDGEKSKAARVIANKMLAVESKLKAKQDRAEKRQDRSVYFEDLGVDFIMVDEIHNYKRVPFTTGFDRVKGIDKGSSDRGLGLLLKSRVVQQRRGDGTGVIGATGTPISNTLAEAWNMMRLTSPKLLRQLGIECFDLFARTYCDFVTAIELNEASLKYKEITRMNRFRNGHSLIRAIRSVWDIKMDDSGVSIANIPALKGGEPKMVKCQMTSATDAIMTMIEKIYRDWEMMPDKQDYSFVPLVLMSVGTAASVDPRLVNPHAPDDPDLPVNRMIDNAMRIYSETGGALTQVIFADKYRTMSTRAIDCVLNHSGGLSKMDKDNSDGSDDEEDLDAELKKQNADSDDEEVVEIIASDKADATETVDYELEQLLHFNLYEDIRSKLIERGLAPHQVAVITDYKSDKARKELFARANAGEVKFVIGSTPKLGQGVNIQEMLYAGHHLDPPASMTHSALSQRNGRLVRQRSNGNIPEVELYYYGVEGSTIPAILNRIQKKGEFTMQLLSGRGIGVEFDDPCAVDLESMKSMLVRDPRVHQLAEMKKEAYDEALQIGVQERMRGNLISSRRSKEVEAQETLNKLDGVRQIKEAVIELTKPVDETDKDAVLRFAATQTIAEKDIREPEIALKDFRKIAKDRIKAWTAIELGRHDNPLIGKIELNGIKFDVLKHKMATTDEWGLYLQARNPVNSAPFGSDMKFATPEALILGLNRTREKMIDFADRTESTYKHCMTECERLDGVIANTPMPSREKLENIKASIKVLEADLVKNPVSRRDESSDIDFDSITSLASPALVRGNLLCA